VYPQVRRPQLLMGSVAQCSPVLMHDQGLELLFSWLPCVRLHFADGEASLHACVVLRQTQAANCGSPRRVRLRHPNCRSRQTWRLRTAFSSMVANTDWRSPGELLITCNTSDVAVCCSIASSRSRVRRSSSSCRSAIEGLRRAHGPWCTAALRRNRLAGSRFGRLSACSGAPFHCLPQRFTTRHRIALDRSPGRGADGVCAPAK
jgi:hypothetical protein